MAAIAASRLRLNRRSVIGVERIHDATMSAGAELVLDELDERLLTDEIVAALRT